MLKQITKDDFAIKDYKIIEDFNRICSSLRTKNYPNNTFEDRFIFLYKKISCNYSRLEKIYEHVNMLYLTKIREGYDSSSLNKIINSNDLEFISKCIQEHKEFATHMNSIFKVNTSYVKTTVKEKADLYIRKILPIYEDKGVLAALEQIIINDKIPLPVLCSEYFDNLVYYGLVGNTYKLKNCTFYLADLFSLSKIVMCYDILLNKVHQSDTYPELLGDDKEKILKLSNASRYINKLKPGEVSRLLQKINVSQNEISSNMQSYIEYYETSEQEVKKLKTEAEIMSLDLEIEKCSEIITRFINSQYADPDNYITINRINRKKFEKALQVLMDNNHPTYVEYCKKIKKIAEKVDLDKIVEYIKEGITEDGKKIRDFDIVDFYILSSVSTQEAKRLAYKELSYNDYLLISNFHKKYSGDREITETTLKDHLKMNIIIIVDGIQYIASDDDKRAALLELQENKIPLTHYTYKIMLKRYIINRLKQNPSPKLVISKKTTKENQNNE